MDAIISSIIECCQALELSYADPITEEFPGGDLNVLSSAIGARPNTSPANLAADHIDALPSPSSSTVGQDRPFRLMTLHELFRHLQTLRESCSGIVASRQGHALESNSGLSQDSAALSAGGPLARLKNGDPTLFTSLEDAGFGPKFPMIFSSMDAMVAEFEWATLDTSQRLLLEHRTIPSDHQPAIEYKTFETPTYLATMAEEVKVIRFQMRVGRWRYALHAGEDCFMPVIASKGQARSRGYHGYIGESDGYTLKPIAYNALGQNKEPPEGVRIYQSEDCTATDSHSRQTATADAFASGASTRNRRRETSPNNTAPENARGVKRRRCQPASTSAEDNDAFLDYNPRPTRRPRDNGRTAKQRPAALLDDPPNTSRNNQQRSFTDASNGMRPFASTLSTGRSSSATLPVQTPHPLPPPRLVSDIVSKVMLYFIAPNQKLGGLLVPLKDCTTTEAFWAKTAEFLQKFGSPIDDATMAGVNLTVPGHEDFRVGVPWKTEIDYESIIETLGRDRARHEILVVRVECVEK